MFRHKMNNAIVWTLIFSILISVLFNPIEVRADESGNDDLSGGAGDDNYLFSKGYGTDIIEDADGSEYEVQSGNSELISEKNYLLQIEEGVLIITEQPMVEKQPIQESVEEVEEETTEEEVLDE